MSDEKRQAIERPGPGKAACEDATVIAARLAELTRERDAARNFVEPPKYGLLLDAKVAEMAKPLRELLATMTIKPPENDLRTSTVLISQVVTSFEKKLTAFKKAHGNLLSLL